MKKIILAGICSIIVCITGCGGNKKAFEVSSEAYANINTAYAITEQIGNDVYKAWWLGIYEQDELREDGVTCLASKLNLNEDEIKDGVLYVASTIADEETKKNLEENEDIFKENASNMFKVLDDKTLIDFCTWVVTGAYSTNGKFVEVQEALDASKKQMKELSEKYSDYEHYPNLKRYYTTTSAFFDFCQNPTGSFEQMQDTINKYNDEARDYSSDLDYIFEE